MDSCGWLALTWLFLAGSGKVGDAGVRTHEHIAGVQQPLQETLLGFRNVNPSERSLGQRVGGNQRQTVHAHLVDAVDGLEGNTTSSEGRRVRPDASPGRGRAPVEPLTAALGRHAALKGVETLCSTRKHGRTCVRSCHRTHTPNVCLCTNS